MVSALVVALIEVMVSGSGKLTDFEGMVLNSKERGVEAIGTAEVIDSMEPLLAGRVFSMLNDDCRVEIAVLTI